MLLTDRNADSLAYFLTLATKQLINISLVIGTMGDEPCNLKSKCFEYPTFPSGKY